MTIAVNPDTGAVQFLDTDGAWKPAQRAINPQTKEMMAHDGKDWVAVPAQSKGVLGYIDDAVRSIASGVIVNMPDGTPVRFPDDMPPEQIRSLIAQKFPDAVKALDRPSLSRMATDIPGELYKGAVEPLAAANAALNPLSEAAQARRARGEPPSFLDTGKALISPIMAAGGAIAAIPRAVGGNLLGVGDTALRSGAASLYGDENVAPPLSAEEAKGRVGQAMSGMRPAGAPAQVSAPVGNVAQPYEIPATRPNLAWEPPTAAPPAAPSPAVEAGRAAENIGVDLPKAIATDGPFQRFVGQVVARAPGGGPLQSAVQKAVEQAGQAVGRASEMAGGRADAEAAGYNFSKAITDYFKPAMKQKVSEAYDRVTQLVDKNATSPLAETQGAIADITSRRLASGESDPGKAVATVLGGATRPGGLTFEGIKDLRTRVGEMVDTGIFPEGMSQGELRRIYGALSDDLKAAARNTGGSDAVAAFEKANSLNRVVEQWKDKLEKVIGSDSRSGEGVTEAIIRLAGTGASADAKTLAMARAAVPEDAWRNVASTAISRLGQRKNGEWSPATFLTDYAELSDRGKSLLFGGLDTKLAPFLDDIVKVSEKFGEAGKLANTSGTAGHNALYTMGIGAGAGLLHGSLIEPMAAVSAVLGVNLTARALATPATVANMSRWTRAYQAAVSNPTPAAVTALNNTSRALADSVNGQLIGKQQLRGEDFMKAIQGPAGAKSSDDQAPGSRP